MTPLIVLIGSWIFWFTVGAFTFRWCVGGAFNCIRYGHKAKFRHWIGFFFGTLVTVFLIALVRCS